MTSPYHAFLSVRHALNVLTQRQLGFLYARVPLALRNCTGDRRRLIRAVGGLGVAALLILMQLGFRDAFLESALTIVHAFEGDLVLTNVNHYRVGQNERIPRRRMYQALAVPGVQSAAPLHFEWRKGRWKSPLDGRALVIRAVAIDPDYPAIRISGLTENLQALKQPNTAVMDRRGRRHLGKIVPGLHSELGRREVSIVGTFAMGPDFVTDGTVIMSERNFATFFADPELPGQYQQNLDMAFLKLRSDANIAEVQAALQKALPDDVKVITRAELVAIETAFQAALTPAGPIFGLGAVIGFIVGILIAYQILFTEISDRLPQFATLKAIGYGNMYLLGVILRQSVIYGLAGFVSALAVSVVAFAAIDYLFLIPMRVSANLFWTTLIMLITMCIVAGIVASRRALTADPAEVF